MGFTKFILVATDAPVLITTVFAAIHYKRMEHEYKVFSWFLFLSCCIHLASLLLWCFSVNNMPVLHLYVAGGFVCMAWFYSTLMNGFINKTIISAITLAFLIFTTINTLCFQSIFTFNSNALTVESILIIVLSLSTYILFLNESVKEKIKPVFTGLMWINSGFFIYYTSCLVIFYLGNTIISRFSDDFNRYTWLIHSFFTFIMYTCFFIGLWKRQKN